MTNQPSRISAILSVASLLIIMMPKSVDAQEVLARQAKLCELLPERSQQIIKQLESRQQSYSQALGSQNDRVKSYRNEIDEKVAKLQAQADINRTQAYELLANKQTNPDTEARAKEFAAQVDQAVTARRQAYSTARQEFRAAVDALLAARAQPVIPSIEEFKTEVQSALDEASDNCRSGENPSLFRSGFVDRLKQARLDYSSGLKNRENFGNQVKLAADSRNAKYKQATLEFQQRMQQLKADYSDLE